MLIFVSLRRMSLLAKLPAPLVVGTVHSPAALKAALKLKAGRVDILEVRVDAFAKDPELLLKLIPKLTAPLLLTVRHPEEGGAIRYSTERRRELIRQFLPHAQWLDVEVRSLVLLREEIAVARERGVKLVVSDHHFKRLPSLEALKQRFKRAQICAPEVVKVAATANSREELERLLVFFNWSQKRRPGQLSLMGMGDWGRVSRLLFGGSGSALNYGYLGEAQVPGQWPAELLKERLNELVGGYGSNA
jgi:3-dehydroquinate dehydratase-1